MKKLIKILLAVSFLCALSAGAGVLEVNPSAKVVYWHPTPTLELQIIDLERDGGVMTVSLEYDGNATRVELNAINQQYPGYEVEGVTAATTSNTAQLSIAAIGLASDLPVRNGQMGPYINSQLSLSVSQMRQLKSMGNSLDQAVQIVLGGRVTFKTNVEIESYTASSNICQELSATNVRSLIKAIDNFERPRAIRNSQTFRNLKSQMIDQCFNLRTTNLYVSSWTDLLNIQLSKAQLTQNIVARYVEQESKTQTIQIVPIVKSRIN